MSLNSTTPTIAFEIRTFNRLSEVFQKLSQVFKEYNLPVSAINFGERNDTNAATTNKISRRNLDLYQISSRVNRSFYTSWDGPSPFSTIYIVLIILVLGVISALIWLGCACLYHTMRRIKSFCPSWKSKSKESDPEDPGIKSKEFPTPEILEQRRQDRLLLLKKDFEHLEQQIKDERNQTLASRASDSDLEYLLTMEDSPSLKRNSISLQDIPQSVVKIRREKQLRQLKEEIEHLQNLSRQVSERDLYGSTKIPLLTDFKFDNQGRESSSSNSPVEVSVIEPLSLHISHLKAQRKLQEIRTDIEDLAIHLIHADEIKAKTSSLQDLPRSALVAKRQENLLNISKEIENIRSYKLKEKNVIHSVLPVKLLREEKHEILAKLNKESGKNTFSKTGNQSTSKTHLLLQTQESENLGSTTENHPGFVHSSSFKKTREQELNRVRVELKELSYKLNLKYSFDHGRDQDKESMLQNWSGQSCFPRENSIK